MALQQDGNASPEEPNTTNTSLAADDYSDCEQPETCFEFSGHRLKITQHSKTLFGVSAFIWDAGIFLCKYIEKQNMDFTGKKVIELGSGTGLVGIFAGLLGANVTLTDRWHVLDQIKSNVFANIPASALDRCKVCALLWGTDHTHFPSDYDFIFGSDIVYNKDFYTLLPKTLEHLSNAGTEIYLASAMRSQKIVYFHEVTLPQYFKCDLVCNDENRLISIYRLTKKYTEPGK
ncbi:EEF1A lysine methyltransferase 3-like [Callorhinchus milii]|uniref:Protein-lysine methyltransferase METTL21B-like n=1 Tax=Callorhinchus milii TaxID=7868 RepID=A0A4W3JIG0_CALMI|nr:EEF1A lysine methyltransferase 3-like [Callorhinchus milii]|eukprot:gi/632977213/ref/XP_007905224.1/ PREDICTED: protein-lysine methyltransferase METTL21B-like [Callorhinchus milii]